MQLLDPPLHAALAAAGALDMLFCVRAVLLACKRDFPLDDVPALWEACAVCPTTPALHLYVAFALLAHCRCASGIGPCCGKPDVAASVACGTA